MVKLMVKLMDDCGETDGDGSIVWFDCDFPALAFVEKNT